MEDRHDDIHGEIEDLRLELEHFQKEKERVRAIIGKIGGVPKFHNKLFNIGFVIGVVATIILSAIVPAWRLLMIEVATVALSLKIIYLIHCQNRINHFEFWVLSSIEWRLNELTRLTRQMKKAAG